LLTLAPNFASGSNCDVNISWGPVGGAASYEVYRSAAAGGPYAFVSSTTTTSATDTFTVPHANAYSYVIRAFGPSGDRVAASAPGRYTVVGC
jgi:hypothetical protein